MMKYKLPVTIEKISEDEYMARSELVRATAVGTTPEEAVENLRESIEEMIKEYGFDLVFKEGEPFTVHVKHGSTRKYSHRLVEAVAKDLAVTKEEFIQWYYSV